MLLTAIAELSHIAQTIHCPTSGSGQHCPEDTCRSAAAKLAAASQALNNGKTAYRLLQRCGVLSLPPAPPAHAQSPHPPQPPAGSQGPKLKRALAGNVQHRATAIHVTGFDEARNNGRLAGMRSRLAQASHTLHALASTGGPFIGGRPHWAGQCSCPGMHWCQRCAGCLQLQAVSEPELPDLDRLQDMPFVAWSAWAACQGALQLAQQADHSKLTLTGSRTCTVSSSSWSPRLEAS